VRQEEKRREEEIRQWEQADKDQAEEGALHPEMWVWSELLQAQYLMRAMEVVNKRGSLIDISMTPPAPMRLIEPPPLPKNSKKHLHETSTNDDSREKTKQPDVKMGGAILVDIASEVATSVWPKNKRESDSFFMQLVLIVIL